MPWRGIEDQAGHFMGIPADVSLHAARSCGLEGVQGRQRQDRTTKWTRVQSVTLQEGARLSRRYSMAVDGHCAVGHGGAHKCRERQNNHLFSGRGPAL